MNVQPLTMYLKSLRMKQDNEMKQPSEVSKPQGSEKIVPEEAAKLVSQGLGLLIKGLVQIKNSITLATFKNKKANQSGKTGLKQLDTSTVAHSSSPVSQEDPIRASGSNYREHVKKPCEEVNWDEVGKKIDEGMDQVGKSLEEVEVTWDEVGNKIEEEMDRVDWDDIGSKIQKGIAQVDWEGIGMTMRDWCNTTDWDKIGEQIADAFNDHSENEKTGEGKEQVKTPKTDQDDVKKEAKKGTGDENKPPKNLDFSETDEESEDEFDEHDWF